MLCPVSRADPFIPYTPFSNKEIGERFGGSVTLRYEIGTRLKERMREDESLSDDMRNLENAVSCQLTP